MAAKVATTMPVASAASPRAAAAGPEAIASRATAIKAGTTVSSSPRGKTGVRINAAMKVRNIQAGKRPRSAVNFQNTKKNTAADAKYANQIRT